LGSVAFERSIDRAKKGEQMEKPEEKAQENTEPEPKVARISMVDVEEVARIATSAGREAQLCPTRMCWWCDPPDPC
jgi:hypothetical protein